MEKKKNEFLVLKIGQFERTSKNALTSVCIESILDFSRLLKAQVESGTSLKF